MKYRQNRVKFKYMIFCEVLVENVLGELNGEEASYHVALHILARLPASVSVSAHTSSHNGTTLLQLHHTNIPHNGSPSHF